MECLCTRGAFRFFVHAEHLCLSSPGDATDEHANQWGGGGRRAAWFGNCTSCFDSFWTL